MLILIQSRYLIATTVYKEMWWGGDVYALLNITFSLWALRICVKNPGNKSNCWVFVNVVA